MSFMIRPDGTVEHNSQTISYIRSTHAYEPGTLFLTDMQYDAWEKEQKKEQLKGRKQSKRQAPTQTQSMELGFFGRLSRFVHETATPAGRDQRYQRETYEYWENQRDILQQDKQKNAQIDKTYNDLVNRAKQLLSEDQQKTIKRHRGHVDRGVLEQLTEGCQTIIRKMNIENAFILNHIEPSQLKALVQKAEQELLDYSEKLQAGMEDVRVTNLRQDRSRRQEAGTLPPNEWTHQEQAYKNITTPSKSDKRYFDDYNRRLGRLKRDHFHGKSGWDSSTREAIDQMVYKLWSDHPSLKINMRSVADSIQKDLALQGAPINTESSDPGSRY